MLFTSPLTVSIASLTADSVVLYSYSTLSSSVCLALKIAVYVSLTALKAVFLIVMTAESIMLVACACACVRVF